MKGKSFVLTVLLTGLGTMILAQPTIQIAPKTVPGGTYGAVYAKQTLSVTGGKPPYSFSVSTGQLPPGMNLSTGGVFSGTPAAAGTYSFTIKAQGKAHGTGPGSGTGSSVSQSFTLTVVPAALTITAKNANMVYGGSVPALSVSITGFAQGDGPSSLGSQPTASTAATGASPAGTYPITASGGSDPNYSFIYRSGTLTVGKARLTITADDKTMPFGGPMPVLTVSYAGFVNADNATSLASRPAIQTAATATSPPGTYTITASGALDPNYSMNYSPGTLTISSAPRVASIRVTANAASKTYGTPDPLFTYSTGNLPAGTNSGIFSGSLSRTPGENVGTYPITIGSLSAGKYVIDYSGNYLTISKASQQIDWSQNLLVGCHSASQVQLNAVASSGLPVTYTVSDNSVATVSGNQLTLLNPGTAVVTAVQAGNGNYSAAIASDTLFYPPASLISQHWGDVLLFDNSSGDFVQWQWYKDGAAIAGDTTAYYSESPSLDGQYFVIATNKEGQQVQSCTLTVNGNDAAVGGIRVVPNPAVRGGLVNIVCDYQPGTLQGAVLQIVDIHGRILQQASSVQPTTPVTMPAANGIYIVNLILANGQRISTNALIGK